jgi:proteasome lid subunit RPN8/RPN11
MDWFTDEVKNAIALHSNEPPPPGAIVPEEICGVILLSGEVVRSPNINPTPSQYFTLDPQILSSAKTGGLRAIYHNHPGDSQRLSFEDIALSKQFKIPILLHHPESGFDYFDPSGANPYPLKGSAYTPEEIEFYLNWAWDWGRVDCGQLIYRYFQGRLGLDLKMPTTSEHGKEILAKGWNKYEESLIENGFIKVEVMQENDIALMNLRSTFGNKHHGAIALDDQHVLHIRDDNDSSHVELFHSDLQHKTDSIWRHPKFQ